VLFVSLTINLIDECLLLQKEEEMEDQSCAYCENSLPVDDHAQGCAQAKKAGG
jgi:hypothetical protein